MSTTRQKPERRYFIKEDQQLRGPFTLSQLMRRRIMPGTLVWDEAGFRWVKASVVEELQVLFGQAPTPSSPPERGFFSWLRRTL